MMRRAFHSAAAAIPLIRRGFASKFHNEQRRVPTIDFSSIREPNDAIRLFRETVAMSPQPSFLVYNKLLSVLVKMEEYTLALYMFDEMRHSRFPVDECTMNIIINCCCHLNRVDLGFAVMGSFLKHNYKPNVTTLSTLLRGVFLVGNVAEAEALFQKVLVFKLCQLDDVMIFTLVNGLCKSGQTLKARNLLWDFEKTGYKPDVKAYSAVIDGLCKDGMVDDAMHLLIEMSNNGVQPDVVTYNTIIHGLCEDGRVDDALHLLSDMPDKLIQPNVVTYSIIIHGLCEDGRVDDALHLISEMPDKGVWPNVVTYNTIIHGLYKEGKTDDALHLLSEMPNKGIGPDVVAYHTITHGLCKGGRIHDALHLLSEMPDKGIRPDVVMYNTIIHGFCEDGRIDDALHLLSKMPNKGIRPDVVTYNTITHGLCKDGRIDDALHLLSEMPNKGIRPDVVMYNTIINGYAQHGLMKDALQIYDSMLSNGINPDDVTFLAVLSSCAHVGALEKALYHFGSMTKDFGITPTLYHLACVVSLYARKGDTKVAYDLVRNFPCAPNVVGWTCLLSGCVMNADLDLARLAAEEILSIDPNDASAHVMLSNVYAGLNMWEEVSKVRELMKEKKVKKDKGCSWI